MRKFVEERNFEEESLDYMVIGHYNDVVILQNEEDELFYLKGCEESMAPVGTYLSDPEIHPIEEMSGIYREYILSELGIGETTSHE